MGESNDARAGWGQEARERNKLACQTLDKGKVKKAICKRSSYATNLVSGPQDIKQPWPPGGAAWAPDPRGRRRECWEVLPSGGILMTKHGQESRIT